MRPRLFFGAIMNVGFFCRVCEDKILCHNFGNENKACPPPPSAVPSRLRSWVAACDPADPKYTDNQAVPPPSGGFCIMLSRSASNSSSLIVLPTCVRAWTLSELVYCVRELVYCVRGLGADGGGGRLS